MTDDLDDYVPTCGAVCPCPPPPGTWYAGECLLDAGHDGLHDTHHCPPYAKDSRRSE